MPDCNMISGVENVSERSKVYVAGSINIDHMYKCPVLPRAGVCVPAPNYIRQIGGKGLNQAYALFQAKCANVKFHGFLGSDGIWILDYLKSVDFPVEDIVACEEKSTGNVLILMREDMGDENATMIFYGANACFNMNSFKQFLKDSCQSDIVVFQNEMNEVEEFIRIARDELGLITVFNPSPHPPTCSSEEWQRKFRTNVLVINYPEALMILENFGLNMPEPSIEVILENIAKMTGVELLILTVGKEGAYAWYLGRTTHRKAHASEDLKVVDTTGAGDAFLGYFLESWIATKDLEQSLKIANAAAFLTITREGTMLSIPKKSDVFTVLH